jgi:magnesium transporter
MDAFASMISNNLNVVMKFLAAITVILMIPTLIASIYGMNVALPLAGQPWAFAAVVAASLAGGVAVALVFVKRRWI